MSIADILELPKNQMLKHIEALAKEYKILTGRTVCRTCGGDVSFMLSYLKNYKTMSNFQFKNPTAIFRLAKGKPERVSQSVLTDSLAIDYISRNKERAGLFKSLPDNWEELVDAFLVSQGKEIPQKYEDCCDDEHEGEPCDDCIRKSLQKLSMSKLKKQYPEVQITFAMKKADLVEAIVELKLAEAKKA